MDGLASMYGHKCARCDNKLALHGGGDVNLALVIADSGGLFVQGLNYSAQYLLVHPGANILTDGNK